MSQQLLKVHLHDQIFTSNSLQSWAVHLLQTQFWQSIHVHLVVSLNVWREVIGRCLRLSGLCLKQVQLIVEANMKEIFDCVYVPYIRPTDVLLLLYLHVSPPTGSSFTAVHLFIHVDGMINHIVNCFCLACDYASFYNYHTTYAHHILFC